MASKGGKVSKREINRMCQLYETLGSYSAVAKKVRRDRSTVAKYIQKQEAVEKTAEFAKTLHEAQKENKTININI